MVSIYDGFMRPLEAKWLHKIRGEIMPTASGHVLEIGVGTGVNFKYYDLARFKSYTALDLEPMIEIPGLKEARIDVHAHIGSVERMPFDDNVFDTVIESLVLCSVKDMTASVDEMIRVLKPGGKLIFIDHVAPDNQVMKWLFTGADHIWPHVAGGCHLTRSPQHMIGDKSVKWIIDGRKEGSLFKYGVVEKL